MAARSKPSQVIDQTMRVGALGVLAVPGQEPDRLAVRPVLMRYPARDRTGLRPDLRLAESCVASLDSADVVLNNGLS